VTVCFEERRSQEIHTENVEMETATQSTNDRICLIFLVVIPPSFSILCDPQDLTTCGRKHEEYTLPENHGGINW
jgi:hypothetical protein